MSSGVARRVEAIANGETVGKRVVDRVDQVQRRVDRR